MLGLQQWMPRAPPGLVGYQVDMPRCVAMLSRTALQQNDSSPAGSECEGTRGHAVAGPLTAEEQKLHRELELRTWAGALAIANRQREQQQQQPQEFRPRSGSSSPDFSFEVGSNDGQCSPMGAEQQWFASTVLGTAASAHTAEKARGVKQRMAASPARVLASPAAAAAQVVAALSSAAAANSQPATTPAMAATALGGSWGRGGMGGGGRGSGSNGGQGLSRTALQRTTQHLEAGFGQPSAAAPGARSGRPTKLPRREGGRGSGRFAARLPVADSDNIFRPPVPEQVSRRAGQPKQQGQADHSMSCLTCAAAHRQLTN